MIKAADIPGAIKRKGSILIVMGLSAHTFGARLWLIVLATFLGFLGIGAVLPGLAPHVRHDLGGSDQTVGFVIGAFSFIALLSRFISGPLADRRGRRVALMAGLASCGLAGGAYFLPIGIPGAFLGRMLQGFGEACLYTGGAAWVIEVAGVERGGQALGYLSTGIWGGIAAGPVLGHWLGSFEHAAAAQFVLGFAGCLVLLKVPESYRPSPHPARRHLIPRSLIAPGLAIGFVNVHYPVVAGFLILHLRNHGESGPAAFTAYAAVILCSRFFLGGLPDRIRPSITYYAGLGFMAAGLLIIAAGPPKALAIAAAGMLGLGFSFPWASIASTVLKRTPQGERGSVVGILSAFLDLFVGTSSFAAGAVANHFGYSAAFAMAAIALLASAVAGRYVFPRETDEVAPAPAAELCETIVG